MDRREFIAAVRGGFVCPECGHRAGSHMARPFTLEPGPCREARVETGTAESTGFGLMPRVVQCRCDFFMRDTTRMAELKGGAAEGRVPMTLDLGVRAQVWVAEADEEAMRWLHRTIIESAHAEVQAIIEAKVAAWNEEREQGVSRRVPNTLFEMLVGRPPDCPEDAAFFERLVRRLAGGR